jgi:uncharacterized protein (DUF2147 family)
MKILFIGILLFGALSWSQEKSVVGKWKTIDDDTGKPKSIVEIFKDGEEFKARILELINPDEPNPLCDKCTGEKENKPVKGMEIMSGVEEVEKGEEWGDGEILDPKNGKTYSVRLRLKENGDRLEVRGYIGISLLGRNQTWHRNP